MNFVKGNVSSKNNRAFDVDEGHSNCENMYTDQTVNNPDHHGNILLHNAVIQDDEDLLSNLLQHSCIDPNFKNYNSETPLQLALRKHWPYPFIMQLIHSGANLNATNTTGQNSLHMALRYCDDDENLLHELIKNGVDINAQDDKKRTPLHYAVKFNNMEAVCMLLYYAVDVSILNYENKTPFSFALYHNRIEIAEVLFDYYDDFSDADCDGYTALHWAILEQNPIASDLVIAGADVNCVTDDDQNPLIMCLKSGNMELFELIWPKCNYYLLLNTEVPFLHTFTLSPSSYMSVAAYKWLNAMYLVLHCPILFELLDDYKNFFISGRHCFNDILLTLSDLNIKLCDRLNIISTLLSLGSEINVFDINAVLILYGFDEELEMFLYCTDYHAQHDRLSDKLTLLPQCRFIFSTDDPNIKTVIQLFKNFLMARYFYSADDEILENCLLNNLRFFSMSFDQKLDLYNYYRIACMDSAVINKINALPELPSLMELSRNQARKFIMQTFKITRAYQFHDAVKRLKLPCCIQDILRFKVPLY